MNTTKLQLDGLNGGQDISSAGRIGKLSDFALVAASKFGAFIGLVILVKLIAN